MFPFAFFFVGIILFIVLAVLGSQQEKKRKETLAQWARSKGLSFDEARDKNMRHRFDSFACLKSGGDRYAYNIMQGTSGGRGLLLFDYHYETTSTDSKGRTTTHNHYMTVAIVQPPYQLKPLKIRAEGFFDKIGEFFGFDDIDFESAEFSRKFHVQSPDRKWTYDVLHARAMEHLLNAPRYPIEFDHASAIVWTTGKAKPETYTALLHTLEGLFEQMPAYVVQQQRG